MTTTNLRDDVDELVAKYQPRDNPLVDLDQLDDALRTARARFEPIPLRPTTSADDAHVMTFPSEDESPTTDLPLEALVDVTAGAIDACGTLIDTLPNLRRAEPTSAETTAWDIHRRKAYLEAETHCAKAWQSLMHAQQLVKGLAR